MSPQLNFSNAVKGDVAETAFASSVVVMGKDLGVDAVGSIAETIGTYAREGVARPVNALAANTVGTPGGGLEPRGNEVKVPYKGAEMFGVESPKSP